MATKIIRVFGKEIPTTNGGKFVKYTYVDKNGTFYDVHFNKGTIIPQLTGYVKFTVDTENISIQKGKEKTIKAKTFKENDKLWIKQVNSVDIDVEYAKEIEARKRVEIEAILGD